MQKKYRNCQSCGTSIVKSKKRGTEKDGKRARKYCYHCYENGKFLQDISCDEMKENFFVFLTVDRNYPKFFAKLRVKNLHKLERWKKK